MALSIEQARKLLAKAEKGDARSAANVIRALLDADIIPPSLTTVIAELDALEVVVDALETEFDAFVAGQRERLTANRTYYVRTDGSDSNTGLVDSAGGAFLTLQKAADVIYDDLDLNGFVVTVDVGNGTYTGGVDVSGPFVGATGPESVVFTGDTVTPANVIISTTSDDCFAIRYGAKVTVAGMELRTTTSGDCLSSEYQGSIIRWSSLRFGACAGAHMSVITGGQILRNDSNSYSIVGGAVYHWSCISGGHIRTSGGTITLTGTPAFSGAFALAYTTGYIAATSITFSGAATGKRFDCDLCGVIKVNGAATTYLPGSVAGTETNGGNYD